MIEIERHTTAAAINAVLNDPTVRPWVADAAEGVLDVSRLATNPANYVLMGEHGGCAFVQLLPGVYEVHTQIRAAGRGAWAAEFSRAVAHWMFTRTDAYEVVTRVPRGHVAALALTRGIGFRYEFTREGECRFQGDTVPVDCFSMRIQDWLVHAEGLVERGRWLHDRMHQEADRLGITVPAHADDENHNRYAGAAIEMALHGRPGKAVTIYNRWALMSRHETIAYIQADPPTIKFDIGLLRVVDGDIEVLREH